MYQHLPDERFEYVHGYIGADQGLNYAQKSRLHFRATAAMITRFLTDVRVSFNPFSPRSKPARLFLSLIPPSARETGMKIESKMLPRHSKEPATLGVKFSMCSIFSRGLKNSVLCTRIG